VLILASCLLIGTVSAQTWVPGIPITPRRSRAIYVDKTVACADAGNKVICNSDGAPNSCDATIVYACGTSAATKPDVICGGPAPYCVADSNGDNAKCSATPLASCPANTLNFKCTDTGIFPDPNDCHTFYNCYQVAISGVNTLLAQGFTCPNLYVFDPSGPKNPDYCRLTYNAYCTTSGCTTNDIKNVPLSYPWLLSGQYVATCQKTSPTIVTFCPPNYDVNVSTLPASCTMNCKNPVGKFRIIGTTNQYFVCAWNGFGYTPTPETCLYPKIFDITVKDCVNP